MRTSSAKTIDSVDVDVDSTTIADDGLYRTNNETINLKIVEHSDVNENVPFIFPHTPNECSGCVVTHAILIV